MLTYAIHLQVFIYNYRKQLQTFQKCIVLWRRKRVFDKSMPLAERGSESVQESKEELDLIFATLNNKTHPHASGQMPRVRC